MLPCFHALLFLDEFPMHFSLAVFMRTFGLFYVNGYPFVIVVWNVFLAMAPFGFFLLFSSYWRKTKFKKIGQKIWAAVIFLFWFVFLPNSAYLVVGSRHLLNFCPADSSNSICVPAAWEIMFFFIYSILGWVLFDIFLIQMRELLAKIFTARISRNLIYVFIPVVSWGVLFGLTERFNSWDLFIHPLLISQNLLRYLTNWEYFRNWLVFAIGYYILYFFGDYLFGKKIKQV
jgi:uncharacterized membrane protein